jgi:hypothetical protein
VWWELAGGRGGGGGGTGSGVELCPAASALRPALPTHRAPGLPRLPQLPPPSRNQSLPVASEAGGLCG